MTTSQGIPKIVNEPLEGRGEARNRFFLRAPGRNRSCLQTSGLQNREKKFPIVSTTQVVALCYSRPRKLIYQARSAGLT